MTASILFLRWFYLLALKHFQCHFLLLCLLLCICYWFIHRYFNRGLTFAAQNHKQLRILLLCFYPTMLLPWSEKFCSLQLRPADVVVWFSWCIKTWRSFQNSNNQNKALVTFALVAQTGLWQGRALSKSQAELSSRFSRTLTWFWSYWSANSAVLFVFQYNSGRCL